MGIFYTIPTKSALKKAIKKERILLNGKIATTANFIHKYDVIELIEIEAKTKKIYRLETKIHFEDDFLAIIEKPAGISVSGNKFATISNALPQILQPSSQADATQPFPVHRLDYPTSGLLLCGKTAQSRRILHKMFEMQEIKKTYHAVAVGKRDKLNGKFISELDGKIAETNFEVVESIKSERFEALNLIKLNPKTGRKHQLRKQLLEFGNPIMGDKTYFIKEKQHQGYGLYLHASQLELVHPFTKDLIQAKSTLPKKFKRLFPDYYL